MPPFKIVILNIITYNWKICNINALFFHYNDWNCHRKWFVLHFTCSTMKKNCAFAQFCHKCQNISLWHLFFFFLAPKENRTSLAILRDFSVGCSSKFSLRVIQSINCVASVVQTLSMLLIFMLDFCSPPTKMFFLQRHFVRFFVIFIYFFVQFQIFKLQLKNVLNCVKIYL